MTVYYQHIGERLSARDFPRSLGTPTNGLKRFQFKDAEEFLQHLNPLEIADIKSKTQQLAPTGFQIWGIPSGAQRVVTNMQTGDYLMLLESTDFTYCGQVIHRVSDLCHDLSYDIWGEQRFPIIIFLQGELISYGWDEFVEDFSFAPNYHMPATRRTSVRIAWRARSLATRTTSSRIFLLRRALIRLTRRRTFEHLQKGCTSI